VTGLKYVNAADAAFLYSFVQVTSGGKGMILRSRIIPLLSVIENKIPKI
jgi:hypothetical protein